MCPQVSWQACTEKRWYKLKVIWQIHDKLQQSMCLHREWNTKLHTKSVSDVRDISWSHGALSGPTSLPGPSSRLKGQQNFNAHLRHRRHRKLNEEEVKQEAKRRRKKREGRRKRRKMKDTKKELIKTRKRRQEIRKRKIIKRNSQTTIACFHQKRMLAIHVTCIDLTPNRQILICASVRMFHLRNHLKHSG
jgi:hypothetical protein